MKQNRSNKFFSMGLAISLMCILVFTKNGTAQDKAMLNLPKTEIVRNQLQAMMMFDTLLMFMPYTEDIEIYHFPDSIMAKGISGVRTYWKKKIEEHKEVNYDVMDVMVVGDSYLAKVREMDHSAGIQRVVVFIFQFKEDLIQKIFYLLG